MSILMFCLGAFFLVMASLSNRAIEGMKTWGYENREAHLPSHGAIVLHRVICLLGAGVATVSAVWIMAQ